MTSFHLGETATDIAGTVGAFKRRGDHDALRDFCDRLTYGELDALQLDILTGMVARRIKAGHPSCRVNPF